MDSAWNQFGDTLHGIFNIIQGIVKAIGWIIGAASKVNQAINFIHGGDPFSAENRKKLEASGGRGPSIDNHGGRPRRVHGPLQ